MSGRWEDCPCCGKATFHDGSLQWDGARVPCGCNCWVSVDEDEDGDGVGYIAFDGPCERCLTRDLWVDGLDSEARLAARDGIHRGFSSLGARVLAEATRALQWHRGGMRVAQAPRLSRAAALHIADMAWCLGVGEDPHQ